MQKDRRVRVSIETVDVAVQDKPNLLNDMGGDVRVKEESGSLKYAAKNYTIRSALVQSSTHESIQSYYTQHQSNTNTTSINNQ